MKGMKGMPKRCGFVIPFIPSIPVKILWLFRL